MFHLKALDKSACRQVVIVACRVINLFVLPDVLPGNLWARTKSPPDKWQIRRVDKRGRPCASHPTQPASQNMVLGRQSHGKKLLWIVLFVRHENGLYCSIPSFATIVSGLNIWPLPSPSPSPLPPNKVFVEARENYLCLSWNSFVIGDQSLRGEKTTLLSFLLHFTHP